MATDNATTGTDTIIQLDGVNYLTVTNTDQIQASDFFDGGGYDVILIGESSGQFLVDLSAAGTGSTHGFHNYEAILFKSVTDLSTVTLNAAQFGGFGGTLISESLFIAGQDGQTQVIFINNASNFSANRWTFTSWEAVDHVIISGTAGNDSLEASSQSDALIGGFGKDIITGGLGADIFLFAKLADSHKGANRDVITDFNHSQDDTIDLSRIDAKKGGADNVFKFIGKHDFHDKKGELHYVKKAGFLLVEGDVNGDGKADFQIEVHGAGALHATDFAL